MKLVPRPPVGKMLNLCVTNDFWTESPAMFTDRPLNHAAQEGLALAADVICAKMSSDMAGVVYPPERVNYAFIHCPSITFEYEFDPESPGNYIFGQVLPLIILRADLWDAFSLSPLQIAAVILEEICHLCYAIHDEYQVKLKVVELLNLKIPVSFNTLYSSFPGVTALH